MASIKNVFLDDQNANKLAGVTFDTTTYGTAAPLTIRVGRDVVDGGLYVIAGTQTSVNCVVVMDLVNATHGAKVIVKRQPAAVSTSVLTIVSGSAAGGTAGVLGTSTSGHITTVFDGEAQIWR